MTAQLELSMQPQHGATLPREAIGDLLLVMVKPCQSFAALPLQREMKKNGAISGENDNCSIKTTLMHDKKRECRCMIHCSDNCDRSTYGHRHITLVQS